ncbi:hypothetical protein [Mycobacterium sp. E2733]|uniref:hypothetical protein n=1 Tax=Mycobacterium sp. E2733 TaxID=1834138 RepID=UPI0007FE9C9A|nr:hypothetical protein [Mycobacterium sp. E2733]OBH98698.1 hypothetical protein A5678_21865 [Mycobacterium sp. E2733]
MNLTQQESSLIGQSHPAALMRMDEKSLKELQSRLRQARDKNFSLLRRRGAARVEAEVRAAPPRRPTKSAGEKVEIFDEALARVSERLAATGDGE